MDKPSSSVVTYSVGGLCTILLALALMSSTGVHTVQSKDFSTSPPMSRNDEGDLGASSQADSTSRDDWKNISDPTERRMAQNRIAQRKYRLKQRKQNVERAYIEANQAAAGSAYASTEPEDLKANDTPTGLPWGSINMRDVVEKGKAREQRSQPSGTGSSQAGNTG